MASPSKPSAQEHGQMLMLRNIRCLLLAIALLAESAHADAQQGDRSRCFGSVSQGRLEHASKLPVTGANFQAFSGAAAALGRTHTHSRVQAIVLDAYAAIAAQQPELRFVYGEASWPQGGRLRPHRTHQNGLSIDFFVPVRDAAGRSVPIPTSPFTRFGYDLEFDQHGRLGELQIDFEALAEHLFQLQQAARKREAGIALVILDTRYLPALNATRRGRALRQQLNFLPRQAWVRHDEHYHVDFALPCAPLPR